jgi:hypothetical protein
MEVDKIVPPRMMAGTVETELRKIAQVIMRMADRDIFQWLETGNAPNDAEIIRASTIVADRLCGTLTDPIVRNAQEKRQLALIKKWLESRGYSYVATGSGLKFDSMKPREFAFHIGIPVRLEGGNKTVNIPVDTAIMLRDSKPGRMPLLIEAKSAGDYTNPNKRRKEEAMKISQLKNTYGSSIRYILFLCGYFDSGYLGYEAAEGIDWVWEHRIDDLEEFGV